VPHVDIPCRLPLRHLQGHFTPRLEFQVIPDAASALSLKSFHMPKSTASERFPFEDVPVAVAIPEARCFILNVSAFALYVRSTKLTQLSCGIDQPHLLDAAMHSVVPTYRPTAAIW
jgi:hypothetical protein